MKNRYIDYFKKANIKTISPPYYLREYIDQYILFQNYSHNFNDLFIRALPNGKVSLIILLYNNKVLCNVNSNKEKLSNFVFGIFEPRLSPYFKPLTHFSLFKGISVSFTYTGVHKIVGIPLIQTTNEILDFDLLFSNNETLILEKINTTESDTEKINLLNHLFIEIIDKNNCKIPKNLNHISKLLNNKRGRLTIDEISKHINLSYKSLYRLFSNHIGIGPKTFLKILRFNQACSLLRDNSLYNWQELVYHCGYYDQAHFINEFKAIMKETPHHFLDESQGHFYHNRAFSFK